MRLFPIDTRNNKRFPENKTAKIELVNVSESEIPSVDKTTRKTTGQMESYAERYEGNTLPTNISILGVKKVSRKPQQLLCTLNELCNGQGFLR
jgi:hypothetical protein